MKRFLLFLAFLPLSLQAQDRLPLDEAIRTGTLDNGLSWMVRANDTPEKRAELRLVLNAGSILEADDQLGLAHFVEHMAFNGTRSFEKQALVEYLESIGMQFGPDVNAYTSFDETVYMLQLPTDDAQILDTGLRILREWAGDVTFDPEEIDKERGVVIEEWRLRQGGSNRIQNLQYPVLLGGSRYPERLPIGTEENLRTFPHDRLTAYYRDWYRPNLMTVIAVGDFDAEAIEARIQELFGDLVNPSNAPERTFFPVPGHAEPRLSMATDPEAGFASVELSWKHANPDRGTRQTYREDLERGLFASMLNRRLGELTQSADPPFIGAGGGSGSLVRTASSFDLSASVQNGQYLRALRVILEEVERVRQHGFTGSEFDRARLSRLRSMEVAWNERENQRSSSLAAEYLRHVLSGEAVPGIDAEFRLIQRLLPAISLDDINALVPELMTAENQVILLSGTEEHPMPSEADVWAVFEAAASSALEPYDDGSQDEPLIAEQPVPGSVVSEQYREDVQLTEWTLSNGARVYLRPTDFKADEILLSAWSPGGASLVPDSMYTSASLTSSIVGGSGVGTFNAIDLSKKLTGKVARIRPYVGLLDEGFSGSASPQDLETLFQLAYLYGTAPRADSTVFASFISRMNSMLATIQTNPQSAFGDTLAVTVNNYHWRSRPMSADVLAEADLGQIESIFADRFADFSDFSFLLVGSFEPADIKPLVEQYLASLPGTGRQESWEDVGMRAPEGVVEKTVRRGIEPSAQVALVFQQDFAFSMETRRTLNLLQAALDTRLREVLREDLGGTYGVSVQASLRNQPYEHVQLVIVFGCDPGRVEELVASVWDTIRALQTDGPSDVHLANAREQAFRSWETGLEENGWWLNSLEFYLSNDMDPARLLINPADVLAEVSASDVSGLARQVLRNDQYIRVTLLPESETP
jgi:zinc protease